jgi:hypothetical protein
MLWPALGRRTARIVTARVAMVVGLILCGAWLLSFASELPTRVPMWIPLVMLGLFLCFSARQDLAAAVAPDWTDQPAGYQVSSDGLDLLDEMWTSADDDEGVLVEHQQRPQPEQIRREREAIEDARVDDILARLHDSSWDQLSPDEIAILQRASQRYRQRRHASDDHERD